MKTTIAPMQCNRTTDNYSRWTFFNHHPENHVGSFEKAWKIDAFIKDFEAVKLLHNLNVFFDLRSDFLIPHTYSISRMITAKLSCRYRFDEGRTRKIHTYTRIKINEKGEKYRCFPQHIDRWWKKKCLHLLPRTLYSFYIITCNAIKITTIKEIFTFKKAGCWQHNIIIGIFLSKFCEYLRIKNRIQEAKNTFGIHLARIYILISNKI